MQSRSRTLLAIGLLSIARLVAAQGGRYPIKEYDLSNSTYKSEKVRCPRTIEATHLNVLRYGYAWNSEVTFDKAPDLWGALATAAAPADTKLTTNAKPPAAAPLESGKTPKQMEEEEEIRCQKDPANPFGAARSLYCRARALRARVNQESALGAQRIIAEVHDQRGEVQDLINRKVNAAIRAVKDGGSDLQNLMKDSSGDPGSLQHALTSRLTNPSVFLAGIEAQWPFDELSTKRSVAQTLVSDIAAAIATARLNFAQGSAEISSLESQLHSESGSLSQQLAKISAGASQTLQDKITADDEALAALAVAKTIPPSDLNDLDYASKEADKTVAALDDVSETGVKYAQFRDAKSELSRWRDRMAELKVVLDKASDPANPDKTPVAERMVAALSLRHDADGEFAFSQTKKTALTLTRTDLMPGAKDTKPETILDVTVECTSPFTVSAGVAFSSLQQREFAIVPSKDPNNPTNVINKFESTSTSNFHPLPLGMIHARVWEGQGWWENVGLHASFGMAGNFRSQNSGGSDVEFLVGPSVSLFRTMFLTPGLHLGHKVELGGGFKEGDVVPPSITQPPLRKSYKLGFGLAITFTKP
jgi:hypothetical protein